jgi:Ca-activated chloride channel family protein
MNLRLLRDGILLLALALLPAALAGCAAAKAEHEARAHPAAAGPPFVQTLHGHPTAAPARAAVAPAQSLPSPREELWVIQKSPDLARRDAADDRDIPGTGALVLPRGDAFVPVPLKHTDVKANIAGYVATVDVVQQFHNPYDGKIEAVYVFPLPHNGAVSEFVMAVGERRIRGIVRERQEAERIYRQAREQGHVASLLTQERPNVFTQKVANIEPGKAIDVHVRYFHTLAYSDGWYEWVFPMVVGPRFNPPGGTDGFGATGRDGRGASGQKTELQYLKPGERSGHDVAVGVRLDALVPVEQVESRSHKVSVNRQSPQQFDVALDEGDHVANRDFVLRWKVAGDGIKSGVLVRHDKTKEGGHFALMLVPPEDLRRLPRSPVEMVFTLDVSGSMEGRPIGQAKAAVRYALTHMRPDDTFQVVRFAAQADAMSDRPLPATPDNVRRALQFIEGTTAGGGTMLLDGLRKALETPADESRQRYVVFLTDGYIGNDVETLGALQRMLGGSRVFSFGVGSAPNRYLLEHMAKLGRGAVAYLGLDDNADEVMAQYFERVSHSAMTDLAVDWDGAQVSDVYPQRLPDLFVGRPVTLAGRFTGAPPQTVKVTGKLRGEPLTVEARVVPADSGETPTALPSIWARMKIADLADRLALQPDPDVPSQVRQIALEHGLVSAYTAFVAVDAMTRTQGDHGTTVAVPVPVPAGVRYETTVEQ